QNFGGDELFEETGKYDQNALEKEIKSINKLLKKIVKEEKTFRLADKKIKKFGFGGLNHLVENKLEGQLHSGKLTQTLLKDLQKKGVETLFGVEVRSYKKTERKIKLQTNQH